MMNTQPIDSRDSLDVDFSRYMRTIKSRWLLIALLWGGTIGLAGIAASIKPPSYEASAKILVRVDPTSTLTGVGKGVGNLETLVKAQNPLTTEVEIITSNPVVEQVIESLELKDDSGELLDTASFEKRLTVKIVGGADVISLTYQDSEPQRAAAVVNELASLYIDRNILDNQRRTSKALASIEGQLPESQTFVQRAEEELRKFREENRIISLEDESKSIVSVLENLDLAVSQSQAALSEATSETASLQTNLGLNVQQAIALSDISQSVTIQEILSELKEVERQKALQRGIYTEQSPVIRTSNSQELALRQLLSQELQKIVQPGINLPSNALQVGELRQALISQFVEAEVRRLSLENRIDTLTRFRENYRERATSLPVLEQQQAELEQTLKVARSNYQEQLSRLKELEAAEKQDIGNATIIEPALIPEQAVSGEKSAILALGGLFGAFLATTVVTLLTLRDESRFHQRVIANRYLPSSGPVKTPGSVPPPPPPTAGPKNRQTKDKGSSASAKR